MTDKENHTSRELASPDNPTEDSVVNESGENVPTIGPLRIRCKKLITKDYEPIFTEADLAEMDIVNHKKLSHKQLLQLNIKVKLSPYLEIFRISKELTKSNKLGLPLKNEETLKKSNKFKKPWPVKKILKPKKLATSKSIQLNSPIKCFETRKELAQSQIKKPASSASKIVKITEKSIKSRKHKNTLKKPPLDENNGSVIESKKLMNSTPSSPSSLFKKAIKPQQRDLNTEKEAMHSSRDLIDGQLNRRMVKSDDSEIRLTGFETEKNEVDSNGGNEMIKDPKPELLTKNSSAKNFLPMEYTSEYIAKFLEELNTPKSKAKRAYSERDKKDDDKTGCNTIPSYAQGLFPHRYTFSKPPPPPPTMDFNPPAKVEHIEKPPVLNFYKDTMDEKEDVKSTSYEESTYILPVYKDYPETFFSADKDYKEAKEKLQNVRKDADVDTIDLGAKKENYEPAMKKSEVMDSIRTDITQKMYKIDVKSGSEYQHPELSSFQLENSEGHDGNEKISVKPLWSRREFSSRNVTSKFDNRNFDQLRITTKNDSSKISNSHVQSSPRTYATLPTRTITLMKISPNHDFKTFDRSSSGARPILGSEVEPYYGNERWNIDPSKSHYTDRASAERLIVTPHQFADSNPQSHCYNQTQEPKNINSSWMNRGIPTIGHDGNEKISVKPLWSRREFSSRNVTSKFDNRNFDQLRITTKNDSSKISNSHVQSSPRTYATLPTRTITLMKISPNHDFKTFDRSSSGARPILGSEVEPYYGNERWNIDPSKSHYTDRASTKRLIVTPHQFADSNPQSHCWSSSAARPILGSEAEPYYRNERWNIDPSKSHYTDRASTERLIVTPHQFADSNPQSHCYNPSFSTVNAYPGPFDNSRGLVRYPSRPSFVPNHSSWMNRGYDTRGYRRVPYRNNRRRNQAAALQHNHICLHYRMNGECHVPHCQRIHSYN